MSDPSGPEGFLEVFGPPDPATSAGISFENEFRQEDFEDDILGPIGAGWFWDRFLFLWGEGVQQYEPCLEAWSFALPPHTERLIVGRNAYGALLVNFHHNDLEGNRLYVLDPLHASVWNHDEIGFGHWVAAFAPRRDWRDFFDRSVYDAWLATDPPVQMELEHCLAPKRPIPLDGTMELDNFQLESIVDYYKSTGPIYKKAHEGGFEPGADG